MFRDDENDEHTVGEDDRELIADNLQRIKASIYGNVGDSSASRDSGLGTSGRDRDD